MKEIQEALDRAQPGETIEIPGGHYLGALHFPRSGEPGRPITLQAKRGEAVILNGGEKIDAPFTPDPSRTPLRKATTAALPEESGIWEVGSRLRLRQVASLEECEERVASWYYDPERGELWIHPAREAVAPEYWREGSEPVITADQQHLRIEGVAVTLGQHGILLGRKSQHVEVIGCRAYCNRSGGIHLTGSDHRIVGNESFHNNMYGIQCRFGVERCEITENLCYQNGPANEEITDVPEPTDLSIYSKGAYNRFERNIASGSTKNAYRNKYAVSPTTLFRGNVVVGNANPASDAVVGNTFIVEGPGPRAGMYVNGEKAPSESLWEKADPGGRQRAANLIHPAWHREAPRFADPTYFDYRLQARSPYTGLGAEPGFADVYFIDPAKGKAENDGRSLDQPLSSITEALKIAPLGSTLYLMPGGYDEAVEFTTGGTSGEPFRIRAWQRSEEVIATGAWTIRGPQEGKKDYNANSGAEELEIEGVTFRDVPLAIDRAQQITLKNCRFEGQKAGVHLRESTDIAITQCDFIGSDLALHLENAKETRVTQSSFRKVTKVADNTADLYADFNRYEATPVPKWSRPTNDASSLSAASASEHPGLPLGPGFLTAGRFAAAKEGAVTIDELTVAGLAPEGATALWRVRGLSPMAEVTLRALPDGEERRYTPDLKMQIMGEFFDLSFAHQVYFTTRRHFPLPDLTASTRYQLSVTPLARDGSRGETATLEFETPAEAAAPRTWHVAADGDDKASGTDRKKAWRTFRHAVRQLSPGDRLVVANGVYFENLLPVMSGTAAAPIVIATETPGQAVIDLSRGLPVAAALVHTHHVELEGFQFRNGPNRRSFALLVDHSRGVRIAQCEMDYPDGSTFEKPKGVSNGIVVNDAPGIRIEDNLFLCSIIHIALANSPGAVVQHNTVVGEGNYGIVIVPGSASEEYRLEGNLFYRAIMGYKKGGILRVFDPVPKITSEENLYFVPEGHKSAIANWPVGDRIETLAEWQQVTGFDLRSVTAEPLFVAPEERDFRLRPGSPGKGAMSDGSDIGRR